MSLHAFKNPSQCSQTRQTVDREQEREAMEIVWDWRSIGSLLASAMLLRTAMRDFLPPELLHFLTTLLSRIFTSLRPTDTIIIEERDSSGNTNDLFESAQLYLSSRCLSTAPSIRLSKTRNSTSLTSSLPSSHTADDTFQNAPLRWTFSSVQRQSSDPFSRRSDHRYFELSFHRQHRPIIHSLYIPQVLKVAEEIRFKSRERRLYSNRSISPFSDDDRHLWSSVPFTHPSTFDSLAINPTLRDDIRSDLLRFCSRRDYYTRAGRAWKRGYLLHGPPGTGKTSLIAAIANFLDFDVYDLELTAVTSNTNLRKLLVSTTSKSIIVVEDVDCSLDLTDRRRKKKKHDENENDGSETDPTKPKFSTVSLSGVLNFVDGLWSSCVGERLMVFTTNHPERLDPAMLRPGRMDKRISLSYCEAPAFRILARNYLEVEEGHEMMAQAEELLGELRMTPAEVAEILMGCEDVGEGADVGMRKVVEEMRRRKATELLSPPPPVSPRPQVGV